MINSLNNKFRQRPVNYIVQSLIIVLYIFLILLFVDFLSHTAIIASLGATAFIVMAMPHSYFSSRKPLFGGYFVGISTGCLFSLLMGSIFAYYPSLSEINLVIPLFTALAVGASIFFMTVFRMEHPPASGVAMGFLLNSWDIYTLIFIFVSVVIIYTIRYFFEEKLIDLL